MPLPDTELLAWIEEQDALLQRLEAQAIKARQIADQTRQGSVAALASIADTSPEALHLLRKMATDPEYRTAVQVAVDLAHATFVQSAYKMSPERKVQFFARRVVLPIALTGLPTEERAEIRKSVSRAKRSKRKKPG
jgi:uncharacterized membrane protein